MIDVNTFVGGYPYRYVPHPEPAALVRVLEREGIDGAWVGHLPSAFFRDPSPGNRELLALVASNRKLLMPVPVVRPDWPRWSHELRTSRTKHGGSFVLDCGASYHVQGRVKLSIQRDGSRTVTTKGRS